LLLAHAILQREGHVRAVFVFGAVQKRHAQGGELAETPRKLRLLSDRGKELEPAFGQRRAVQQRAIEVQQPASALGLDGRDQSGQLGMVFLFDKRYARQDASLTTLERQFRIRFSRKQNPSEFGFDAIEARLVLGFEAQHDHRRRVRRPREPESIGVLDP